MKNVYIYSIGLVLFLFIDFFWLKWAGKNLYKPEIGHLMRENINIGAAAIFYLFYIFGLCIFIIYPMIEQTKFIKIFLYGALLGAMAYGTYDFTALATFKDFPLKVALVDTLWGALLTGSVCTLTIFITRVLYRN